VNRISKSMLSSLIIMVLLFAVVGGCDSLPESSFELANDSRLPIWFKLPQGLSRADVSVTMNYYIPRTGDDTKMFLRDRSGKTLTEISGKEKCQFPESGYPHYALITANGMTEIIEHKKMEPVFYVNDDPSVRKKLLASGSCPK
jgi:hypothetical protein